MHITRFIAPGKVTEYTSLTVYIGYLGLYGEVTSLSPEYLPGTQGILAYLLETDVSFSILCVCLYEFSLDLFCTFILIYIL